MIISWISGCRTWGLSIERISNVMIHSEFTVYNRWDKLLLMKSSCHNELVRFQDATVTFVFYGPHLFFRNPTSIWWRHMAGQHCFSIWLQCRCAQYDSRTNGFVGKLHKCWAFCLICRNKDASTHWLLKILALPGAISFSDTSPFKFLHCGLERGFWSSFFKSVVMNFLF